MDLIDLVVTVCALAAPANCEEKHLEFQWSGSLQQCANAAPPYIAQWVGEHPKWSAVRWHCEYPHPPDRTEGAPRAQAA
jgi:hypothetical protein